MESFIKTLFLVNVYWIIISSIITVLVKLLKIEHIQSKYLIYNWSFYLLIALFISFQFDMNWISVAPIFITPETFSQNFCLFKKNIFLCKNKLFLVIWRMELLIFLYFFEF